MADAYRKAGELDRAIELCTAGLERHPDYVSAHIVFGRCLIDQKNDPGASAVFRKVLALDPENVLALKILAEIAARGGRYDEAAEWLSRLLSADPMNGDAAEALARAKGRAAQSAAKPTSEPVARLVPEAARPPQRNRDLVIEHAPEEPTSPRLDVKGTPADIETFDGTLDFNAVAHSAAKADGIEVQEEVVLKPQDLVVEGLAHTQFESGIFAMPPEAEEDEPKIDLPLIMPDDGLDAAPPPPPAPPVVPEPAPPFAAAQRAPPRTRRRRPDRRSRTRSRSRTPIPSQALLLRWCRRARPPGRRRTASRSTRCSGTKARAAQVRHRRSRRRRRRRLRRTRVGSHSTSSSARPNNRRAAERSHLRRPSRRRGARAGGSGRRWRTRGTWISSRPGSGASSPSAHRRVERPEPESAGGAGAGAVRAYHPGGNRSANARAGTRARGPGVVDADQPRG